MREQKVKLCYPCELATGDNPSVTLRCLRRGAEEKITCSMCGKRRYGGEFEFEVRKEERGSKGDI